jgi:hypothetical protein
LADPSRLERARAYVNVDLDKPIELIRNEALNGMASSCKR